MRNNRRVYSYQIFAIENSVVPSSLKNRKAFLFHSTTARELNTIILKHSYVNLFSIVNIENGIIIRKISYIFLIIYLMYKVVLIKVNIETRFAVKTFETKVHIPEYQK